MKKKAEPPEDRKEEEQAEAWLGPVEDAPLVEVIRRSFRYSTKISWIPFSDSTSVDSCAEAARQVGCDPTRVARSWLVRWSFRNPDPPTQASHPDWRYFTIFVSGDTVPDEQSLTAFVGLSDVSLIGNRNQLPWGIKGHEISTVKGDFFVLPPLFPPFVVDRRLLFRQRGIDSPFFLWGTTGKGLWRVKCPEEDLGRGIKADTDDVSLGFEDLLGEFDPYFFEAGALPPDSIPPNGNRAAWDACRRHDLPPVAEDVLGALSSIAYDSKAFKFLFSPLDASQLTQAEAYWAQTKTPDAIDAGDNAFFASLCADYRQRIADGIMNEEAALQAKLGLTNFMLVARVGESSWMMFAQTLTVYSALFYPFLGNAFCYDKVDADDRFKAFWPATLPDSEVPFEVLRYLAIRRFLEYARLTQYAQVDITDLADLRANKKSQTAYALWTGVLYKSYSDVVEERKGRKSLGVPVDDELGIRSLCFLRLTPFGFDAYPGTPDDGAPATLLYLFAHSPVANWFAADESVFGETESIARLQKCVSHFDVRALWSISNIEWERRTTLDSMVRELSEKTKKDNKLRGLVNSLGTLGHTALFLAILLAYEPAPVTIAELVDELPWHMFVGDPFEIRSIPRVTFEERSKFLEALSVREVGRETYRVDAGKIVGVLTELVRNAQTRVSDLADGREPPPAPHLLVTVSELELEEVVGIALTNTLSPSRFLSIDAYRRSRQQVPDHYGESDDAVPKGLGVYLARAALRLRASASQRATDSGDRAWLRITLRRDAEGARPVATTAAEGGTELIPAKVSAYRNSWEAMLCLNRI